MFKEKIIIRDLRKKEKFVIDDEYLNGYARICGIYATGAYISLCRHADKDQKAFPSIQRIAKELGVSESSIKRGLNKLEEHGIILRERKGKMLTNRYYLLDKSKWSKRPIRQSDVSVRPIIELPPTCHTVPADLSIERKHNSKETQEKGMSPKATDWLNQLNKITESLTHFSAREHKIIVMRYGLEGGRTHTLEEVAQEFGVTRERIRQIEAKVLEKVRVHWQLQKEIEKLLTDKRRHIQIIGLWIKENDLRPGNAEQMQSLIKRNLRPARLLNGFSDEEIKETLKVVKNTDYLHKFTLETISKYIDEVVAQRKKRGPRIIRYEEVKKPDGTTVVRPIYEKK